MDEWDGGVTCDGELGVCEVVEDGTLSETFLVRRSRWRRRATKPRPRPITKRAMTPTIPPIMEPFSDFKVDPEGRMVLELLGGDPVRSGVTRY